MDKQAVLDTISDLSKMAQFLILVLIFSFAIFTMQFGSHMYDSVAQNGYEGVNVFETKFTVTKIESHIGGFDVTSTGMLCGKSINTTMEYHSSGTNYRIIRVGSVLDYYERKSNNGECELLKYWNNASLLKFIYFCLVEIVCGFLVTVAICGIIDANPEITLDIKINEKFGKIEIKSEKEKEKENENLNCSEILTDSKIHSD